MILAIVLAFALFGSSKTEKDLRAQVAAQEITIGDLRAQLANARVVADGARRTIIVKQAADSSVMRNGSNSAAAAAELAAEAVRLGKENHKELLASSAEVARHTETIKELDRGYVMQTRLLVILTVGLLVQFLIFLRGRTVNAR